MLHDAVKSSHQLWQVKKRLDAPSTRSLQKVREKKNAQTSHEWALFYPDWPRKWLSNFVAGYSLIGLDQNLKTTRKGSIQIRANP